MKMKTRFLNRCYLPFLLLLCITSCNQLDNRISLVQNKLTAQILTESGSCIRLIDFQKTDGVEQNMGVKTYSMNFTATIQYTQNCYKAIPPFDWMPYKNFSVYTNGQPNDAPYMAQGTKVRLYGVAQFEKHDNGWVLISMDITKFEGVQ